MKRLNIMVCPHNPSSRAEGWGWKAGGLLELPSVSVDSWESPGSGRDLASKDKIESNPGRLDF